jgi:hypothetical protein
MVTGSVMICTLSVLFSEGALTYPYGKEDAEMVDMGDIKEKSKELVGDVKKKKSEAEGEVIKQKKIAEGEREKQRREDEVDL